MSTRFILPCLLVLTTFSVPAYASVEACDQLAAHPDDPSKKAQGVAWDALNVQSALQACSAAFRDQPNLARIAYQYGRVLAKKQDFGEALRILQISADAGYPIAFSGLGYVYRNGFKDEKKSFENYKTSAEKGFDRSLTTVGIHYERGIGTDKSGEEALKWYTRAAEKGDGQAMNNIGALYMRGDGVAENPSLALDWYLKAISANHAYSTKNLANPKILPLLEQLSKSDAIARDRDRTAESMCFFSCPPTEQNGRQALTNRVQQTVKMPVVMVKFRKTNGVAGKSNGIETYELHFDADVFLPKGFTENKSDGIQSILSGANASSRAMELHSLMKYDKVGGEKWSEPAMLKASGKVFFRKTERGWEGYDGNVYAK